MKKYSQFIAENDEHRPMMKNSKIPMASHSEHHELQKAVAHHDVSFDHAPVHWVPIHTLHATQDEVDKHHVERKIRDGDVHTKDEPAVVYKHKNKHYLYDGHHKAAGAQKVGRKTVAAYFHDLDKK